MEKSKREGITIVIPVYNRAGIVGRTLQSIYDQTRLPDAMILVDNASTDDTLSKLNEWGDKFLSRGVEVKVLNETRRGGARARQTGLEAVETDKVLFFDSDDVMLPGHIANVVSHFDANPDCDIVLWSTRTLTEDGGMRYKPMVKGRFMDSHQIHATLATQAYGVKTDYILRRGGWDTALHGWDDLELGHRLLLGDPKIVVSEECNVDIYPSGEASITGVDYTHRQGEWEHVIDLMEQNTLRSGRRDIPHIMRLLAYRRVILGALYAREGNSEAAGEQLSRALSCRYTNALQRMYLRMAYIVTARGMRGAGRPVPYLF